MVLGSGHCIGVTELVAMSYYIDLDGKLLSHDVSTIVTLGFSKMYNMLYSAQTKSKDIFVMEGCVRRLSIVVMGCN